MTVAPEGGRFEGREHILPVRVYYEDTDFTGVVYHANHLRFLERGRSDFLRQVFGGHTTFLERPDPFAFAVVRIVLDYRRAARIDDALVVRTAFDSVRGARLLVSQTLERDGEALTTAEVTAVCIDLATRPRKPPRDLVEGLTPWLKPLTP